MWLDRVSQMSFLPARLALVRPQQQQQQLRRPLLSTSTGGETLSLSVRGGGGSRYVRGERPPVASVGAGEGPLSGVGRTVRTEKGAGVGGGLMRGYARTSFGARGSLLVLCASAARGENNIMCCCLLLTTSSTVIASL